MAGDMGIPENIKADNRFSKFQATPLKEQENFKNSVYAEYIENGDGKVGYEDVQYNNIKPGKTIQQFIAKHLGKDWTTELKNELQKLINSFNKRETMRAKGQQLANGTGESHAEYTQRIQQEHNAYTESIKVSYEDAAAQMKDDFNGFKEDAEGAYLQFKNDANNNMIQAKKDNMNSFLQYVADNKINGGSLNFEDGSKIIYNAATNSFSLYVVDEESGNSKTINLGKLDANNKSFANVIDKFASSGQNMNGFARVIKHTDELAEN